MSIFSKTKNLFGSKPKSNAGIQFEINGKQHDLASLAAAIQNSQDKNEVLVAVTVYLAFAKKLLEEGKEQNARDILLGVLNLINGRKDNVLGLEDAWEIITKIKLNDFANRVLGTQL